MIEAWAAVPFVPLLFLLLGDDAAEGSKTLGSMSINSFAGAATTVLAFGLVYCYIPIKDRPQQAHYDYSRRIERMVARDLKAGERS